MSEPHKIKAANSLLLPQVCALLAEGREVVLRARGRSMEPCIHDGTDSLVFRRADRDALAVGDPVLAEVSPGTYVMHRIIAIDGDRITLMGDGNISGTEQCMRKDVYGYLTHIERKGRRIDCNTPAYRRKARILTALRRLVYKIYGTTLYPIKKLIFK